MNSSMNVYVIEGFEKLTPQQVFDISLKHVRTTRKQCAANGVCYYKGIGCAAAPFLNKAGKKKLTNAWCVLAARHEVPETNATLIDAIQKCHDYWNNINDATIAFMDHFNTSMDKVAREHSLTYTPENV